MGQTPSEPCNRIATLDGWRGIAILLVVFVHAQLGLFGHLYERFMIGRHGVAIFFVLSGYLITSRLLNEDRINLKTFYSRRFFRLMPCVWVYLITLVGLSMILPVQVISSDFWSSLFFFRNYFPGDSNQTAMTDQFWSLSIEEQFYLVWPPILFFFGRRKTPWIACLGIIGCSLFRFYHWNFYNSFAGQARTEANIDGILLGCLLALGMRSPAIKLFFRNNSRLVWIMLPLFIWHITRFHYAVPLTENIVIAILIACTSISPHLAISRVLEWKPLKGLGVISYSLYVWQELFTVTHTNGIGIALLPVMGILSWHYIEQPGIEAGKLIAARWRTSRFSSTTMALEDYPT